MRPQVSILLPVYNAAPYLDEAIDSLLAQTLGDFELLILDDGSTDGSLEIARGRNDCRVTVFSADRNRGLVAMLNWGLREMRGVYVARMDADDVAMPQRLALQVAYMENHVDVGVLGSCMQRIDADGRPAGEYDVPPGHASILWAMLFRNPIAHPTVLARPQVLRSGGGYDSAHLASEDLSLWSRLVDCTRFANLQQKLVLYRTHEGSASVSGAARQRANTLDIGRRLAARWLGEEISAQVWKAANPAGAESAERVDAADRSAAIAMLPRLLEGVVASAHPDDVELAELALDLTARLDGLRNLALGDRRGSGIASRCRSALGVAVKGGLAGARRAGSRRG